MADQPRHERTLVKVIVFSTALSFGCLGGVMASLKGFFHGDVSFHFSSGSILGFVLGVFAGWLFWKAVFWMQKKDESAHVSEGSAR